MSSISSLQVELADALSSKVRLAVLGMTGLRLPDDDGAALWREITASLSRLHDEHTGLTSGAVPGTDEARRLYRSVGIDPTRNRPSSEALLRRVISGEGLYRVHPLVDLFNLASVEALLPVGLYDPRRIVGPRIIVQIGEPGWAYDGIRKAQVNVGGRLCLSDALGPFGSPTSDSLRTSIEGAVPEALAVFFAPADGSPARLERAASRAVDLARRHLAADQVTRTVLP